MQNPFIYGDYGPYGNWPNNLSQTSKSANAGYRVAHSSLTGINQSNNFQGVKYSQVNQNFFGSYDPANPLHKCLNDRAALAYSTEALKKYDKNGDGIVTTDEFGQYKPGQTGPYTTEDFNVTGGNAAKAIDLNGDGKISAGEYAAYTIYQDGLKNGNQFNNNNVDGTVTQNEAQLANTQLQQNPDAVKTQLQSIYKDFNLANAENTFTMPNKVQSDPTNQTPINQFGNQNIMQMLLMLMQNMFGFGGQQNTGNYYNLMSQSF